MADDVVRPERLYSNHLEVGYNAFEFVFDFGVRRPEDGVVQFHSGIVSAPGCADMFLRTLQLALHDYEKVHGPIPLPASEEKE